MPQCLNVCVQHTEMLEDGFECCREKVLSDAECKIADGLEIPDVLGKLGSVMINFQEKTVRLNTAWGKQSTHPSPGSDPYPQCCRVSLQGTQVIPPRHEKLRRVAHEFAGVFMGRGTWQDLPNQAQNPHRVSYPLKIPPQTKRSSRED